MQSEETVIGVLNSIAAIRAARELAARQAAHVYLAGDGIRDLFLGLNPSEFDLIGPIEPLEFAREVAQTTPGKVRGNGSGSFVSYVAEPVTLNLVPSKGLPIEQCVNQFYCFSVNCVAFDLEHNRFAYFQDARADIENRLIRAVSPANLASFAPFVPLRAVRLALLDPTFALDHETLISIRSNSALVAEAKPHQVFRELSAIFKSDDYSRGLSVLHHTGLLQEIFKNFLPFAATTEQVRIGDGEMPALTGITDILDAIDDLIEPFHGVLSKQIPDYTLLLRMAALLIPEMRHSFLNTAHADRRRFLVARGEQIETVLGNAMLPSRVFRIRIIAVAYLLGIASTVDGAADIADASRQSVKAFGAWKGLLAAVLICADWLAFAGRGAPRPEMIKLGRTILETNLARLVRNRAQNEGDLNSRS